MRRHRGRIVRIAERVPSSSELLSIQFRLKQLQRLWPHLTTRSSDCFSFLLFSSMKFCTILSKQTELGSNSVATTGATTTDPLKPSFRKCGSSATTFSGAAVEFLRTFGNWKSKNLFSRDFAIGFTDSILIISFGVLKSVG